MQQDSDSGHRLFFALEPPAPIRSEIDAIKEATLQLNSGRGVPASNLHLTLRFLGAQPASLIDQLEGAVRGLRAAPFTLTLDTFGHWSRPRALWIGPRITPVPLLALQAGVETALERVCGIARDPTEYRPHVTLMRKVRAVADLPRISPLAWRVDSFSLMESLSTPEGVRYQTVSRWKLAAKTVG